MWIQDKINVEIKVRVKIKVKIKYFFGIYNDIENENLSNYLDIDLVRSMIILAL